MNITLGVSFDLDNNKMNCYDIVTGFVNHCITLAMCQQIAHSKNKLCIISS